MEISVFYSVFGWDVAQICKQLYAKLAIDPFSYNVHIKWQSRRGLLRELYGVSLNYVYNVLTQFLDMKIRRFNKIYCSPKFFLSKLPIMC